MNKNDFDNTSPINSKLTLKDLSQLNLQENSFSKENLEEMLNQLKSPTQKRKTIFNLKKSPKNQTTSNQEPDIHIPEIPEYRTDGIPISPQKSEKNFTNAIKKKIPLFKEKTKNSKYFLDSTPNHLHRTSLFLHRPNTSRLPKKVSKEDSMELPAFNSFYPQYSKSGKKKPQPVYIVSKNKHPDLPIEDPVMKKSLPKNTILSTALKSMSNRRQSSKDASSSLLNFNQNKKNNASNTTFDPSVLLALKKQRKRQTNEGFDSLKKKSKKRQIRFLKLTQKMKKLRVNYMKKSKNCFVIFFQELLFTRYSRFFTKDYRYHCKRLYPLPKSKMCKNVTMKFKEHLKALIREYEIQNQKKKEMDYDGNHFFVLKPLMLTLKKELIMGTLLKLLDQLSTIFMPFLLKDFLVLLKEDNFGREEFLQASQICLYVFILSLTSGFCYEHSMKYVSSVSSSSGQILRTIFIEKILCSNSSFLTINDSSFVTKILLFEINPVVKFIQSIPSLISAPISIIFSFIVISIRLPIGLWSMIVFLIFVLLVVLINFLHKIIIYRKKLYNSFGSKRAERLNELIKSIKIVKLNNLKDLLMKNVWRSRTEELGQLSKLHFLECILDLIFECTPMLCSLSLIIVYFLQNGKIDAQFAFTIIGVLNNLRRPIVEVSDTLDWYQDFVSSYNNLKLIFKRVSSKPVNDFDNDKLEVGEISMFNCRFGDRKTQSRECKERLFMEQSADTMLSGIWEKKDIAISNLTLKIKPGKKVCLIGMENSGIDDMILVLLGELVRMEGRLYKNGEINCLDLEKSEIFETSLRENIVLSTKFNQKKFDDILEVVELDINKYIGRDRYIFKTPKFVSKIEKLKILTARLLYQESDILIFHNIFQIITPNLTKRFYYRIIQGYLACNTVIFSSNSKFLAKKSDLILVFNRGTLVQQGKYSELLRDKGNLFYKLITKDDERTGKGINEPIQQVAEFMNNWGERKSSGGQKEIIEDEYSKHINRRRNAIGNLEYNKISKLQKFEKNLKGDRVYIFYLALVHSIIFVKKIKRMIQRKKKAAEEKKISLKRVVIDEDELEDSEFFSILGRYLKYKGTAKWAFVLSIFLFTGVLYVFTDIWIGFWSENSLGFSNTRSYMIIYIVIALTTSVFILIRDIIYQKFITGLANKIYLNSINNVVNAEMEWHNMVSWEKIRYRLTMDQSIADGKIVSDFLKILENGLLLITGFIVLNVYYFGYFTIISILIMIYGGLLVRRFFKVSHLLLKNVNLNKSKLFDTYIQAMTNTVSLRSIKEDNYFYPKIKYQSNKFQNSKTHLMNFSMRWIGIRVVFLTSFMILVTYGIPIISKIWAPVKFGNKQWQIGLSITWASQMIAALKNFLRLFVRASVEVRAIGRLFEILDNDMLENDDGKGLEYDKSKFENVIIVQNVNFSQGRKKIVSDLSLKIKFGEKVALMGEEGSGRRALVDLILGMKKPEEREESCIFLFGKYISDLKPAEYRDKVQYLNESSELFSGTLRENVDPSHKFSDEEIIKTLHFLHFLEILKRDTGKFDNRELAEYMATLKFQKGMLDGRVIKKSMMKKKDGMSKLVEENFEKGFNSRKNKSIYRKWKDVYERKERLRKRAVDERKKAQVNFERELEDISFIKNDFSIGANLSPIHRKRKNFDGEESDRLELIHEKEEHEFDNSILPQDLKIEFKLMKDKSNGANGSVNRENNSDLEVSAFSDEHFYTKKTRKLRGIIRVIPILKVLLSEARKNLEHKKERERFFKLMKKLKIDQEKALGINKPPKKKMTLYEKNVKRKLKFQENIKQMAEDSRKSSTFFVNGFDSNLDQSKFENYEIQDKEEKTILGSLLYMMIEKEGKNCTKAQKRIINLSRVWLEQPEIVFFEEKALVVDELEDPFYFKTFFERMEEKTLICFMRDAKRCKYFDRLIYFQEGKVVEDGDIVDLYYNKQSKFYRDMVSNEKKRHEKEIKLVRRMKGSVLINPKNRKLILKALLGVDLNG